MSPRNSPRNRAFAKPSRGGSEKSSSSACCICWAVSAWSSSPGRGAARSGRRVDIQGSLRIRVSLRGRSILRIDAARRSPPAGHLPQSRVLSQPVRKESAESQHKKGYESFLINVSGKIGKAVVWLEPLEMPLGVHTENLTRNGAEHSADLRSMLAEQTAAQAQQCSGYHQTIEPLADKPQENVISQDSSDCRADESKDVAGDLPGCDGHRMSSLAIRGIDSLP